MKRFVLGTLFALLLSGCAPSDVPAPVPAAGTSSTPTSLAALVPSPAPVRYGSDKVPVGTFVYYDDFEKGFDDWELPPAPAADTVGLRALKAPACGGLWTVHIGLPEQKPYIPSVGSFMLSKKAPLDLSKAQKPWFKYDVKGVTFPAEALDLTAEIRPPGGDWQPVGRRIVGGYVFMASIGADLTAYAGQKLGLRFVATLKPGQDASKGIWLDDVVVIEPAGSAN